MLTGMMRRAPSGRADGRAWLVVREPGRPERSVPVERLPLTLGRDGANGLVLADRFVSARHAEIVGHAGGHAIRDLGSSNGTTLLGRPIVPGTLHPLVDGATLELGDAHLTYRCVSAGSAPNGAAAPAPTPAAAPGRSATRVLERPATDSPSSPQPGPQPQSRPKPAGPARPSLVRRGLGRGVRLSLWLLLWAVVAGGLAAGIAWLLAPPRVALLVLGSDARPDELRRGVAGRTDTMLAVVADRSPGGMVLISIPRDVWVEIPNYGGERINAAYAIGGMRAAERAAANLLGIPVDRALLIGLQGVRDVVDAAGGIDIDVPRAIHDDAYPTDDYGTMVLDIPAGRQHMDGEMALRYARTRHQDNDFGRMARQQQVMVALRTKLLHPTNWWRAPAVLAAVQRATQTDLGPLDVATLTFALAGGGAEPERLALDLGLVEEFQGANGAYLLRPRPALKERVAALVTPSAAAVEVLNGTSTAGLAMQTADRLRAEKMRVVRTGNAGPTPATVVEVRPGYRRTGAFTAALLGLPGSAVRESAALPDDVDVRVTLGGGSG